MRSNHQNHAPTPGRVDGPGLLYGGIGLALAVAMQLVGLFKMGDEFDPRVSSLPFMDEPHFEDIRQKSVESDK